MERRIEKIVKHAEVSEKAIERYLARRVKENGGQCLKFTSFYVGGYPDRIVMLPGGWLAWVELKSKGEKPTYLQAFRHEELKGLGQRVYIADSREKVDRIINDWKNWKQ